MVIPDTQDSGLKTGITLNDDYKGPEADAEPVTEENLAAEAADDNIAETGTEEKIPGETPPEEEAEKPEGDETPPEDKEEYVDLDDWRPQFKNIPEDIKTPDDMATLLDALLAEKAKGQTSAIDPELDALLKEHNMTVAGLKEKLKAKPETSPKKDEDDPYLRGELKPTSAMKLITDLIAENKIEAEDIPYWKSHGHIMDTVINPLYQNQDALLGSMQFVASQLKSTMDRADRAEKFIRNYQYNDYVGKLGKDIPPMKREELDNIIQRIPDINDYVEAHAYVAMKDPKALLAWSRSAIQKAEKTAVKKLRMAGFSPKGTGVNAPSEDINQYILPSGKLNTAALVKLPKSQYDRVMKKIEEHAAKDM